MKHVILLTLPILFAVQLAIAKTYHTSQPANAISEYEAKRLAFNNAKTVIYKCDMQMITEKGTFKNVPATGSNNFIVTPSDDVKASVKGKVQ